MKQLLHCLYLIPLLLVCSTVFIVLFVGYLIYDAFKKP
jgi:hypothetical protein